MSKTEKNYAVEKNIYLAGTPFREGYEVRTTIALEYGIEFDDSRAIVEVKQSANYEDACDVYLANVKRYQQEVDEGQADQVLIEVFGLRNGAHYSLWDYRITSI